VTSEGKSPAGGHDDAAAPLAEHPTFDTSVAHQARMYDYWLPSHLSLAGFWLVHSSGAGYARSSPRTSTAIRCSAPHQDIQ
jgi:hypothetical protein